MGVKDSGLDIRQGDSVKDSGLNIGQSGCVKDSIA